MKTLVISLFILVGNLTYAGGFKWPNVEYEYAQLYLLNIPFEGPQTLDYHVYANGVYAKSKVGNGWQLTDEFLDEFHGAMARGVNELVAGLSKCYIPRHGIIYFDKKGEPVASFTACFECERISFWSINGTPEFKVDYDHYDIDKAESQVVNFKELLSKNKLPFFAQPEEYEAFLDSNEQYKMMGEMFYHEDPNDSIFHQHFSKGDVWTWINKSDFGSSVFEEVEEVKITAGGQRYKFNKLTDNKGSELYFTEDENPVLTNAVITNPKMILPNGISVGMSLDDVITRFGVYDGITWPAHISLEKKKYEIDYYFKRQTLIRICLTSK